ncbi:MAG: response regulator [Chitinivibrionales bacterium]|nr:response regulator [Chitinivibrionales bacterium]
MSHILIVEDNEAAVFGYERYLKGKGHLTKAAESIGDATALLREQAFDVALLDIGLPDGSGLDLLTFIKQDSPLTSVIIITGQNEVKLAVEAMQKGAENFLTKPVNMEELSVSIDKALDIRTLRKRDSNVQRLAGAAEPFFGDSRGMQDALNLAKIGAQEETVILLTGETGTGKGVFAKWIHDNSRRKNESFVELNCSALKGDLLKSELYGHAKGAFTSAIKDRTGLVEVADKGTLFLDEIGDMDQEVQAQLLKTIEEKSFRRIGENTIRHSDFRLICATNRELAEEVNRGAFRSDLYFRICVFPIKLPSLRERSDDIEGLASFLLARLGYQHLPLGSDVKKLISEQSWTGNVRELRNALERAMLLSQRGPLGPNHFTGLTHFTVAPQQSEPDTLNIEAMEKRYIQKALLRYKNKSKACKELGISMSSLYRKIEQYKLDDKDSAE